MVPMGFWIHMCRCSCWLVRSPTRGHLRSTRRFWRTEKQHVTFRMGSKSLFKRMYTYLVSSFSNRWNVVHGLYLGIIIGLLILWSGNASVREGSSWGSEWGTSILWAGITLLFVTIPVIGEAALKSLLRFLGTLIGGGIALASWMILPKAWYMSIVGGLLIFFTYVIGLTVKYIEYGTKLCGVTYLIVCLSGLDQEDPNLQVVKVAVTRIVGISLGIGIGLVISITHPCSASEKIHVNIGLALENLSKVVHTSLHNVQPETAARTPEITSGTPTISEAIDCVRSRIAKAQGMLDAARMELGVFSIFHYKVYLPWIFLKRPRTGKVPVHEIADMLKLLRRACYVIDMVVDATSIDHDSFLRYAIQIVQGEDLMVQLVSECCETFEQLANRFKNYEGCTNDHLHKFDYAARTFLQNSFNMRRKLIHAEFYQIVVDEVDGSAKMTVDELGKLILEHDSVTTPTARLHYYELQVALEALLTLLPSLVESGTIVNKKWPFTNYQSETGPDSLSDKEMSTGVKWPGTDAALPIA